MAELSYNKSAILKHTEALTLIWNIAKDGHQTKLPLTEKSIKTIPKLNLQYAKLNSQHEP